MNRKTVCAQALIWALAVVLAAPSWAVAQDQENGKTFSQAELDQMLAPVALYPDSLLAQVLIAATYPDQVAEADQWVKAHSDLKGDELNAALDKMNWDLSVKALVPFPQVLGMMDEHMDWTSKLGQAFLAQQQDVMGEIQKMRQKSYAAGNLKTTEQQKVVVSGQDIEIQPAQPDVVNVPYYDPSAVYGNWWWPGYPPFAWYPLGNPYIWAGLFGFGWGIGVGPAWGWGWGRWNWGGRNVYINANRTVNINSRHVNFNRNTMRTANLTRVARTGVRDPVRTAATRAGGRVYPAGTRTGAAGRTAAGARAGAAGGAGAFTRHGGAGGTAGAGNAVRRPSAGTVTNELRHGGAGRGGSRAGNVNRGAGRTTGNVARGGGGSRTHGNVSRGGTGRERDIGARGGSSRGGGSRGGFARGGGHGGGGHHGGGGGGRGGDGHGGGAHRGGGGGGHGGGGHGGGGKR